MAYEESREQTLCFGAGVLVCGIVLSAGLWYLAEHAVPVGERVEPPPYVEEYEPDPPDVRTPEYEGPIERLPGGRA